MSRLRTVHNGRVKLYGTPGGFRQFREAFNQVFQARITTVRHRYAEPRKGGHRYKEVGLKHPGIEEACRLPWALVCRSGSRHDTGVDDREDMKMKACNKFVGGDHDACRVCECDTELVAKLASELQTSGERRRL